MNRRGRWHRRRCILTLAALTTVAMVLLNRGAQAEGEESTWTEITYKGKRYVSLREVARFYGFSFEMRDKSFTLTSEHVTIRGRGSSKALVLNGLIFFLSHRVLPWGDGAILSSFDLASVLDPILRPTAERKPTQLTNIVLNPAHGGTTPGVSENGAVEKDIVLDLALRIRSALGRRPFRVVLTREGDIDLSVEERLSLAHALPGESVFISLHLAHGNPKARGLEVYTLPPPGTPATYDRDSAPVPYSFRPGNINERQNTALAVAVQSQAFHENLVSGGIKRARFPELKAISVPAIYCRVGNLSHREEALQLTNPAYRERLATAVANGIRRYARVMEQGIEEHLLEREKMPLQFSKVEVFPDRVRSLHGEKRRVRFEIKARKLGEIDPEKVDVQVYFFDLVNGEKIDLTTANPPGVEWISVLPDWKSTDREVLEVTYEHPTPTPDELSSFGQRFYYGFVARLIYDGRLADSHSQPTNLDRGLFHFTPVYP